MADPWMKFYPADWRSDPRLRTVSMAARGLWMEMLCVMHEADRYGDLSVNGSSVGAEQLARIAGASLDDVSEWLTELEAAGVYSVRKNGTIYSRRMERDENKRRKLRENGKKGGNPKLCKQSGNEPLLIQEDKTTEARSQKPEAREEKQKPSVSSKRGTRLPEGWKPSERNFADASSMGMSSKAISDEADKFRDYWIAKPGAGGVKLDWDATWRNWCRNASSRQAGKRQHGPSVQSLQELFADELGDADGRGSNVVAFGGRA